MNRAELSSWLFIIIIVGSGTFGETVKTDWNNLEPNHVAGDALQPPDHLKPKTEADFNLPGMPKFLKTPPEVVYASRQRPALIECSAQPATFMNIVCAPGGPGGLGGALDDKPETSGALGGSGKFVKTQNQPSYTVEGSKYSIKLTVTENEVESWFDKFWCYCEAWNRVPSLNEDRAVMTHKTEVRTAYLEKRFVQEPLSTSVVNGKEVQFICHPPAGRPAPTVHWLKNGKRIDPSKEKNVIVTGEGYLVITQTSMADKGNYTCVADNDAGLTRRSEPASLHIFVNGNWSPWRQDISCPAKCFADGLCPAGCSKFVQRKSRKCDQPAPQGGGAPCLGPAVEETHCDRLCVVDGGWSPWLKWERCTRSCVQSRRRYCTNPAPKLGGKPCLPIHGGMETRNCSSGFCTQGYIESDPSPFHKTRDIAMYFGLFVAVCVLLTVVVIVIYLIRRRSFLFFNSSEMLQYQIQADSFPDSKDGSSTKTRELLLPPDITQTHSTKNNPGRRRPEPPNSYRRTPSTGSSPNSACPPPPSLSLILPPSNTSPYSSVIESAYYPHPDLRSRAANTPFLSGMYHEVPLSAIGTGQTAMALPQRLPNPPMFGPVINADAGLACAIVSSTGGRLALPELGISLTIPPGAVPLGFSEEIFLAVDSNESDRPSLQDGQTLLSSLIVCGPPCLQLYKPLILTFPHCAPPKYGPWSLQVLASNAAINQPPEWREFVSVGHEAPNSPAYCHLDNDVCHLMISQLRRFCLIGCTTPGSGSGAHKSLRLAAFTHPITGPGHDFQIRVYVLNDTKDAFEKVVNMESKQKGRLLDAPKQLLFQDNGENLCFCIEELSMGWRSRLPSKYQEVPFSHVWANCQENLHCSFSLEHLETCRVDLSCRIVIYQSNCYGNRQVINISANVNQIPGIDYTNQVTQSPSYPSFVMSPAEVVFRIPERCKENLCNILDTPTSSGNNWRMLARQLGIDRQLAYFAAQPSPTEAILDLWEARQRDESALPELKKILRAIGRSDAANALDQ